LTRKIIGAVVGIFLAVLVVAAVRTVGAFLFPSPEFPANPTPEEWNEAMLAVPLGAKFMVVLSWFLGALIGVWVSLLISKGARRSALSVAGVMLLLTTTVLLSATYPAWMVAAGLFLPIAATFLASRIVPFARA